MLESIVTFLTELDLRALIGVGERNKDLDGEVLVSGGSLEVIELVGSSNNLGCSLDDLEGFVVASAASVDLGLAVVDKVSVFLSDFAVLGSSNHDF